MTFKRFSALMLSLLLLLTILPEMLPAALAKPNEYGCPNTSNGKHDWDGARYRDPWCEWAGGYIYVCRKCHKEVFEETAPALGHKWPEWTVISSSLPFSSCLTSPPLPCCCRHWVLVPVVCMTSARADGGSCFTSSAAVDWYCSISSFRTARVTTSTDPDLRTNLFHNQHYRGTRNTFECLCFFIRTNHRP